MSPRKGLQHAEADDLVKRNDQVHLRTLQALLAKISEKIYDIGSLRAYSIYNSAEVSHPRDISTKLINCFLHILSWPQLLWRSSKISLENRS